MPEPDRRFEDFALGDYVSFTRRFAHKDFESFAALSGDRNPLHADPGYARKTAFGEPILPVHMVAAPFSAIAGMMIPGRRALYLGSEMRALAPARFEREITYSARVVGRSEMARVLTLRVIAFEGGDILLEGEIRVQVRDDGPPGTESEAPVPVLNAGGQRLALITGASGAIGGAVARRLAARGWNLLLHYRGDKDRAAALAKACVAEGVEAKAVAADLASAAAVERLAGKCGEATLLVHAASPPLTDPVDSLVAVNYAALRRLAEALLPAMLRRQEGYVAALGSTALQAFPAGWHDYVAAKAAAVSCVDGLRHRYGRWGVRAMTVAPGYVETPFSEGFRPAEAPALLPEEVAERLVAGLLDRPADGPGYLIVEPGGERPGSFGFHRAAPPAAAAPPRAAAAAPRPEAREAPPPADGELARLVREFFALSGDEDLDQAGLDITPGWDSLRHIELMLATERHFGITLQSRDFEATTRYPQLSELVRARTAGGGSN